MATEPYKGPPFYFCANTQQTTKLVQCPPPVGASPNTNYMSTPPQTEKVLPKKVRVYNKPKHNMTKRELYSWASKFKYR